MSFSAGNRSQHEVWQTVQALNRAWTSGKCDELKDYFHDGMIAITPTDRSRLEGKQACIDGWTRFVAATTKMHYWKEFDPKIQVYGDTAIVTYYFEMSCDMGGKTIQLTGRDMLVLVREKGKWLVVADQFSPNPQS